jgi:uncharacterized membrane protein
MSAMSTLLTCLFFLVLAFNTYHAAKRAGRWSWPQFFVVVATLVAVPVVLVQVIKNVAWLQDKPGLFTLVLVSLILLSVGALAYALNKYWPLPNKPRR